VSKKRKKSPSGRGRSPKARRRRLSDWQPAAWNPRRVSPQAREALADAHALGLRTWVSIEPVIYPDQALQVLNLTTVDTFKVGKLNHDKAREEKIDWRQFLADVLAKLEGRECGYYIKNDLWKWADDAIKERCPRERKAGSEC